MNKKQQTERKKWSKMAALVAALLMLSLVGTFSTAAEENDNTKEPSVSQTADGQNEKEDTERESKEERSGDKDKKKDEKETNGKNDKEEKETEEDGFWINYVCKHCGSTRSFDAIASASADPVTLSRQRVDLLPGETLQLCADDIFNEVSWTSEDSSIATVDEKGFVTAVSMGVTKITAKDKGDNEQSCAVHVKYDPGQDADNPMVQSLYETADTFVLYKFLLEEKLIRKEDRIDADVVFDAQEEDLFPVNDTGLSHEFEEIKVEEVSIDEDALAASMRGEIMQIDIPEEYGTVYSVTCYGVPGWKLSGKEWRSIVPSSRQAAVHQQWIDAGAQYTNGIATIDGRYLIATTTFFGSVGTKVTFVCRNGYELKCIIADSKGAPQEGGNMWGHLKGKNVVEFEVDPDYYTQYGNPGSDAWFPEIAGGVAKALRE